MIVTNKRLACEPKVRLSPHLVPGSRETRILICWTGWRLIYPPYAALDNTRLRLSSGAEIRPNRNIIGVPCIIISRVITPNWIISRRTLIRLSLQQLNLSRIRIILPPTRAPSIIFKHPVLRSPKIKVACTILITTINKRLTIYSFNSNISESAVRISTLKIGHHVMSYFRLISTTPRQIRISRLLTESRDGFISPATNRIAWRIEMHGRLVRRDVYKINRRRCALLINLRPGSSQLWPIWKLGTHFGLCFLKGSKARALKAVLAGLHGFCAITDKRASNR